VPLAEFERLGCCADSVELQHVDEDLPIAKKRKGRLMLLLATLN
jgi:hypothetical protein